MYNNCNNMANIYPKLSTHGARSLLREIAAVKTDLDDSRDFDSTPKRTILQRERVAIGWTRVMDSTVSALSWDVITCIYIKYCINAIYRQRGSYHSHKIRMLMPSEWSSVFIVVIECSPRGKHNLIA